ncbi:MAG: hypothetical protein RL141_1131 [Candidatus Parcubacteria bacterium]
MKILYLAADHAGWELKEALKPALQKAGVTVRDLSPTFVAGDDYPAIGAELAKKVARSKISKGLLVCGSGVGMAIAANRVKGARAVEGMTPRQVALAREHNDVNILTVSGWNQSAQEARALIKTFLDTKASAAARHKRRVKQLG